MRGFETSSCFTRPAVRAVPPRALPAHALRLRAGKYEAAFDVVTDLPGLAARLVPGPVRALGAGAAQLYLLTAHILTGCDRSPHLYGVGWTRLTALLDTLDPAEFVLGNSTKAQKARCAMREALADPRPQTHPCLHPQHARRSGT